MKQVRRYILGILIATSYTGSIMAQSQPQSQVPAPKEIVPPSPNAQAFAKYGNVPVSLYTGVPNISVPIYEIKARGVTVPISLSYHASGVKVGDEASNVGLGWVLNTGGMISRTVINGDDFFGGPEGFLSTFRTAPNLPSDTSSRQIPNPSSPTPFRPGAVQEGVVLKLLNPNDHNPNSFRVFNLENFIDGENADFEPDQFNYNFLGRSGKFMLKRKANNSIEAVLEKKEKIFITTNSGGTSFTVKTADGTTYLFEDLEKYRLQGSSDGGAEHISSWHLSRIISTTGDVVYFDYEVLGNQFIVPIGTLREAKQIFKSSIGCGFDCSDLINNSDVPTYQPGKTYSNIRLKRIRWTNGKVEFFTGSRLDVKGDIKFEKIRIYSKDLITGTYRLKDMYDFGYDYFSEVKPSPVFSVSMSDINTQQLQYRLKLLSMTRRSPEDSANLEYKYRFDYYDGPMVQKNSYTRDHWGYQLAWGNLASLIPNYAYVSNVTNLSQVEGVMGPERDATSAVVTGMLKEIHYPTAGHTEFRYESHTYDKPTQSSTNTIGNWYDSKPFVRAWNDSWTTQDLDLSDEYVDEYGNTVAVEINVGFVYKSGSWPELDACSPTDVGYFEIYKIVNNQESVQKRIGISFNSCVGSNTLDCLQCDKDRKVISVKGAAVLAPGAYKVRAIFNSNNPKLDKISATATYLVDGSIRSKQQPTINSSYLTAGGLRISEIIDYDIETDRPYNHRVFNYHYVDSENKIRSYGKLMVVPKYAYYDIAYERNSQELECLKCVYVIRQSDSYLPATGSMGNAVGYSQVTETFGNTKVVPESLQVLNGKTVYEYSNTPETVLSYIYPGIEGEYNYKMRPPVGSTVSDPLNGMLLKQSDYDKDGILVHKVEYTPTYATMRWEYGIEVRRLVTKNFTNMSIPVDNVFDSTIAFSKKPKSWFNLYVYPSLGSTFVYNSKKKETFRTVNSETITEYFYENPAHLQLTKTRTMTSEQDSIETIYKYPGDYGVTANSTLAEMNKTSTHMPGVVVETKIKNLSSGKVENHTINTFGSFNNHILPKDVVIMNLPVPPTSLPEYNPAAGYDSSLYRKVYTLDYYPDGNVKLVKKKSDVPVTYLWGVRNSFPVAQITNASGSEVFYDSFEEASTGTLTLAPHTGRNYKPGYYDVTFTPPNARQYRIEYWYYENGRWNYQEADYTGSTRLNRAAIDDVRIYPKDASVRTFTYDPLGEVTSVIEPNGKTVIYDYDTFGRLSRIRNGLGEIVKQYTYNYRKY